MIDLQSARHWARNLQQQVLSDGARAVDATMGTGGDTVALCELVGTNGHVDAFDIQQMALDRTKKRLEEQGLCSRATLHCLGHEHMAEVVAPGVSLVCFNLGWLPGSANKTLTTQVGTTLQAVSSAIALLKKGGLLTVCAYPGHEEGAHELQTIYAWMQHFPSNEAQVLLEQYINQPSAPAMLAVVKLKQTVTLPSYSEYIVV